MEQNQQGVAPVITAVVLCALLLNVGATREEEKSGLRDEHKAEKFGEAQTTKVE